MIGSLVALTAAFAPQMPLAGPAMRSSAVTMQVCLCTDGQRAPPGMGRHGQGWVVRTGV
jgi:hypothetical protein